MNKQLSHLLIDLGSLGLATFVRNWMRSLRFECSYADPTVDPAHPQFSGPAIYIVWHEYIPFMYYLRGHCRVAMLVSRHKDAELLSRTAGMMGFDLVRGSTRKGAVAALRGLIRKGNGMNLVLTPDGPRGPRRQLAAGCIYLASRLEIPLVPIGLGYHAPWRNRRAWDHFAIPRPWTRARAVTGPKIHIPPDIPKTEIESWRVRVEQYLNDLTTAAEHSAETGAPVGQPVSLRRACLPLAYHRQPSTNQSAPPSQHGEDATSSNLVPDEDRAEPNHPHAA